MVKLEIQIIPYLLGVGDQFTYNSLRSKYQTIIKRILITVPIQINTPPPIKVKSTLQSNKDFYPHSLRPLTISALFAKATSGNMYRGVQSN